MKLIAFSVRIPYSSTASKCCVAGSLRSNDAVPPCTRKLSSSGNRSALRCWDCSMTYINEPKAQPATLAHTCMHSQYTLLIGF